LPRERNLRIATGIFAFLGLAVAGYVTIVEAGGGSPVCVAGGGGCNAVAESEYAELGGINVALIGVFGYLALLGAAAAPGDPGRAAGLLFSLIGFGFSLYLTYLEIFVIEAICQWCVASAALMTGLLAVCTARALGYLHTIPEQLE